MSGKTGLRKKKTGLRKKKKRRMTRGPKFYTACLLRKFVELSRDPIERAAYARMLQLLEAGNLNAFRNIPGSIGMVNSEGIALIKLSSFLDDQMSWLDAETKVKGRPVYARKVRAAFSSLAKDIGYKGKWEVLSTHLIRKAARMYGW